MRRQLSQRQYDTAYASAFILQHKNSVKMAKNDIVKHQFKKGQSGNPNGRPKGSLNRSTIVKKWFGTKMKGRHPITGEEVEMTLEDWLTIKQLHKGITKSDTQAYKVLNDSRYGQAKENIDVNADVPSINFRELFNFKK